MRILDRDEIGKVLAAADDDHRTLLATAIFTGLRHGELLGLTWSNVDLDGGSVKVRRQLTRSGRREEPKTPQAVRDGSNPSPLSVSSPESFACLCHRHASCACAHVGGLFLGMLAFRARASYCQCYGRAFALKVAPPKQL